MREDVMSDINYEELRLKKSFEKEERKYLENKKSMFSIESFTKPGDGYNHSKFGLSLSKDNKIYSANRNLDSFIIKGKISINADNLLREIIQEIFMKIKYDKINN